MDEDNDWIFDCVMNIFQSPEWEVPIADFIDENCTIFDNETENKLQYTDLHNKFVELVDSILEGQLSNLGITNDQFLNACTKAKSKGFVYRHVLKSLLSLEDFNIFKNTMRKRNMELELETLQQLRRSGSISDDGLNETWKNSLATYEKLVKDSLDEADMLLDLNEKLALKEEKLGNEQASYIAGLPQTEKDQELQKMEKRAIKYEQMAADSQAEISKLQAEFEKKMKIASENEVKEMKNKLMEEEQFAENAKREAERIQTIANTAKTSQPAKSNVNQGQIIEAESQLKNFRKKMDQMQLIQPTQHTDSHTNDLSEKAILDRKKYLQEQRQKILDSKHQKRAEQLEKYKKETDEYVNKEMEKNPSIAEELPEADRKRVALRKQLTQKLKKDLLAEQESKQSLPEPKELESMEDQLLKAQELREEKKLKEKIMEEKMAKEARLRAQNAKKGMSGAEDW